MTSATERSDIGVPRRRLSAVVVLAAMTLALLGLTPIYAPTAGAQSVIEPEVAPTPYRTTGDAPSGSGLGAWVQRVPGIADVRIRSTADGATQRALWSAPTEAGPRPLLVVVHSWSNEYDQHASIPYAMGAQRNGWAMIAPDFRGRFRTPAGTGSDLAVQDVMDAIDFAVAHADIDENNIYVTGFSGGGLMSLLMVGRHPERFAGAVSWVPIYDLAEWYRYAANPRYVGEIANSCGGNPLSSPTAAASCRHRSPRAHLDRARQAGVPVYIGHGIGDTIVLPEQSVWAFNHLADPADRISPQESAVIARRSLPGHLQGQIGAPTYFQPGDPSVLFSRQSAHATLTFFNGGHAGVYNPGLQWIAHQIAASDAHPKVQGAIERLFHVSFNRAPDPEGHEYWVRMYLSGRSLSFVASHFANSSEFQNRFGDLGDEDFVRRVYDHVFGRQPDPEGLAYWTSMLAQGRSRGWMMIGFSQSSEFRHATQTR